MSVDLEKLGVVVQHFNYFKPSKVITFKKKYLFTERERERENIGLQVSLYIHRLYMHLPPEQVNTVFQLAEGEITGGISTERFILNPRSWACFNTWSLPTPGAWDWALNPFREVTEPVSHGWSLNKTLVYKQRANYLYLTKNDEFLATARRQPLPTLTADRAIELCEEKPGYRGDHAQTAPAELTRYFTKMYLSLLDTVSQFPCAWAEHKDTKENHHQSG